MNPNNPLKQYFRQPAIYIRLPSGGKHYATGTLNTSPTGEYAVFPMTAIDEITYRTPDALYNGQATVNVIQSCVPDIRNAWSVPSTDLDTLLVAIRVATYGHDMDFATTCPACKTETEQALDLRTVLDRMQPADYSRTVNVSDMEIFFRPLSYQNLNDNSKMQFESQKLLQAMPDDSVPDSAKITALGDALKKITEITVTALSQSIAAIKTPQALVTESEFIQDFLKNCDRQIFNQVRDFIIELKSNSEMPPLALTCPNCQHSYQQSLTLDMTSFFAPAS
jgi:hypothetical protein